MSRRSDRLRALARLLTGERRIAGAVQQALDVLLDYAARALEAAGYDASVLSDRVWVRALDDTVGPTIEETFAAAWRASQRGDIDPSAYATQHLATVRNRLVGVADEVFDVMRRELVAGRAAHEGIPELSARVGALLTDGQRWANRARMIARTEAVGASNAGADGAARATAATLGIDEGDVVKEWMATSDSRTRKSHKRADGQQVRGMDALFEVGRDRLLHPGDPGGRAEEVVQCRCTPIYMYPGDPDYPTELSLGRVDVDLPPDPDPRRITMTRHADLPLTTSPSPAETVQTVVPGEVIVPGKDGGVRSRASTRGMTAAALADEPCTCCAGVGEHTCGHECYVCDSAGSREAQTEGAGGLAPGEAVVCEGHHGRPDPCNDGRQGAECEHDPDPVDPDTAPPNTPIVASLEAAVTAPTDTAPEAEVPPEGAPAGQPDTSAVTHAGVAVQAADTGRVLLIQRWWDEEDDPEVRGTWEFPGGGLEDGETPEEGAWREFGEETGLPAPAGEVTGGWVSPDGVYQAFLFTTPVEASAFPEGLNPAPASRVDVDPDNPEAETRPDAQAWWTLEQIEDAGAAIRPEVRDHTPWDEFAVPAAEPAPTPEGEEVTAALASLRRAGFAVTVSGAQSATLSVAPATYAPGDLPGAEAIPPEQTTVTGPAPEDVASDGEPFYGIAAPEDVLSGDSRRFSAGGGTWRDLPLPLMAQDATLPEHHGAVRVGRIDVMERDDTTYARPMIRYSGVWDTSPAALEVQRQVGNRVVRSVSVDCDAVTVELQGSDGSTLDPMVDDFPDDGVVVEQATAYRVSGLTVCSIGAFHQAYIANGVLTERVDPEPGQDEVATGGPAAPASPDGEDPVIPEDAIAASAWSLVASATLTAAPARSAFDRPDVLDLNAAGTPLTFSEDGERVYGHLATWGVCHIGIDGVCTEPPVSASNYAYFAVGSVTCDNGERVPVGPLTMDTGHAALTLGHRAAAAHYDNTGAVVADVTMGQDHIGIWYAGVVRRDVTAARRYAAQAAGKVSGDWRGIAGSPELVAALVVNTPGFSIPRPAIRASAAGGEAQVDALVAAGMVTGQREEVPEEWDERRVVDTVVATLDRRNRAAAALTRGTAHAAVHRERRAAAARARLTMRSK